MSPKFNYILTILGAHDLELSQTHGSGTTITVRLSRGDPFPETFRVKVIHLAGGGAPIQSFDVSTMTKETDVDVKRLQPCTEYEFVFTPRLSHFYGETRIRLKTGKLIIELINLLI